MEYKGNKISKNVCRWLNVNESVINIENKHIKKSKTQELNIVQKNINRKMDQNFQNIEYGISQEILNLNRNNLDKYIYLNGNDLGEKELKLEKNNIEVCPKSRSGAIRLKIKNAQNILIDVDLAKNINTTYILEFENIINMVFRIVVEKDSKLDLILIDRDKNKILKLESISVIAKENAKVNLIKIDFGQNNKHLNYTTNLIEDGAETNIDLAYVLSEEENYDMSFHQKHDAKNTKGNILVEGVQKDKSSKIFKGTLEFKKGSKSSIGNEYESVINYSKNSKSISLPILLVHEDDIKGSHSANHGEFDEEQIYYIQSRGFTREQAKNIIAEAKIIPILDKVQNRALKSELKEDLKFKLKKGI